MKDFFHKVRRSVPVEQKIIMIYKDLLGTKQGSNNMIKDAEMTDSS